MQRADPITRVIADRVAKLRRESGLNQAELGDRMAALRPGWSRSTVVKLENYNREVVSVSDLLALALALDVPPVLLIADPRAVDEVPIAADRTVNVWAALQWLVGAARVENSDLQNYPRGSIAITAARDLRSQKTLAAGHDVTLPEDVEREALTQLSLAINFIATTGASLPPGLDVDAIYDRARKLGVYVPGMEHDEVFGSDGGD